MATSMDPKFFEKILRREFDDESISNVTIKDQLPVVGKGENFLSEIRRITLGYTCREKKVDSCVTAEKKIDKETSLIVKKMPEDEGPCLDLVKNQNLFRTENQVLSRILYKAEDLLGKRIGPKFLYMDESNEDPTFLILEDLKPLGFVTKDCMIGLPYAHVTMALESIANFHAASVYLYEQNPDIMRGFDQGLMPENTPAGMFRIFEQTLRMISEECKTWPNPRYRTISDKLHRVEANFVREIVEVVKYDDEEFCVLNHGDCWSNNIMFREDGNGNPVDVRLVDFQLSVYTSPVIDLVYYLYICPSPAIMHKQDEFLEYYLEVLRVAMTMLKCKTQPPTIQDLHKAILKRRMWVVLSALMLYPRIIAEEVETFDDLISTGQTRMNIFKNPMATEVLQKSLLFMDQRGYLD